MEDAQQQSVSIEPLAWGDIGILHALVEKLRYTKDIGYFEKCFELQDKNKRQVFGIFYDRVPAGYCIYNREPKYGLFQKLRIPEIQDLNVLPQFRKRGLASALILHCENLARSEGYSNMGIGVGLSPSYGAAQRLYVKMGYIPDGNGLTYDRKIMTFGEMRPNDDNMSLMMVKNLG